MKALNKYFLLFLAVAFTMGMAQAQTQTAPWLDNFESHSQTTTPTGISTNGWSSPTPAGNPEWNIDAFGSTSSSNTGPSGAYSGTTFAHLETSGISNPGGTAELVSPVVDVSAITTPGVTFYYHMYGATMGSLAVEAWDGAAWVNVWTMTGQQQTAANDPWILAIVDLSTYVTNNTVQVRFVGTVGTSFTGDASIDDVSFDELPTCLPVSNLAATVTSGDTIQVSYTGSTTTPATNFLIEYGPAGFVPGTGTTVSTTNTTEEFAGLGGCQVWDFYVTPQCSPTDIGLTSGPTSASYVGTLNAPYSEAFTSSTIPVCWSQNQTSSFSQWKTTGNPYVLFGTPQVASQTADGSSFVWLDMSSTSSPRYLTMPEINISSLPSAALSFWMFSNASYNVNSAQNTLLVEAADGAGGWDTITVINQDAPDWQFKLYDLSPYTYGTNNDLVQVRFNGISQTSTGTSFYNDIALDDIKIDAFPTAACAPIMAPDTTDFEDGGALNACWEQDTLDNLDWTVGGPGGTPSGGTGPSGPNSGSYYMFLESSSPVSSGDSAILISPPINTANLADAPALYFNYHMFGNDSMKLRVEYEIFGSDSWITAWEQVGAVQGAATDPYEEAYVPLPGAIGSIMRLRFTAVAETNNGATPGPGFAWQSDMAIDDIRIQNVLANDVAITNILTPGNDCGLGVTPVTIEVTNRGFNAQSNIPVFVSVNGGTAVGASIPGPIPGNGGTTTVDVLVDMSALGHYDIMANTSLAGDEIPTNDMMMGSAFHQPQINTEYSEEFEGTDGFWFAEGDWAQGTPAGTVITGAGAGADAFVTNLSGNYSDATTSFLYSPCFDLSGMTQPFLRFSLFWDIEDDWDGAWIEYSTGGTAWTKLGDNDLAGQNWYTDSITNQPIGWAWNGTGANGSGGWVDAIIDLTTYGVTIVQDTRFRFVMFGDATANNEGLGIDNFGIFDGCVDAVLNETVMDESTAGSADGAIMLNPVAGFGSYTFSWSDGSTGNSLSGLAPGTYDVTVTDAFNCQTTGSYTIGTLCPADLGLSSTANPTFGDGSTDGAAQVTATGGTAPYTYSWDNGDTDDYSNGLGAGDYTVVVTDANGCTDTVTVTIETQYLIGTENIEGLTGLNLSPNPAKDYAQLNIAFDKSVDLTVRIADVTGRVLETRNAGNTTSEEMRFDVSNLAEGVYFMQIIADGQIATKRFVVVK